MFIQIIQGKCRDQDKVHALGDKWLRDVSPGAIGWLGGTYGVTDDGTFVGVVRFDSREAAMANSARPEQSAWWAEMEKCFDGSVEFHDAEKVMTMLDGGSDRAGFVQVIRGRIDDPAVIERGLDEMSRIMREKRPEIIGGTIAVEPDGTFTETVAFTNEAEARDGEARAMPVDGPVKHLMQDWDRLTHDLTYLDLHHPWFASAPAATSR